MSVSIGGGGGGGGGGGCGGAVQIPAFTWHMQRYFACVVFAVSPLACVFAEFDESS